MTGTRTAAKCGFAAALAAATILAMRAQGETRAASTRTAPTAPAATPSASRPATPAFHVVHDELGRSVRVSTRPARIVSLAPAITEDLFAVGAGDAVVGVTRYCNFPSAVKTRTVVGGFADPDPERVVALNPDLVIATADTVTRDRFDALVALGLPVYAVNPRDLAGVAATLRHVGEVTGHAEEGEARAAAFEAAVADVDAKLHGVAPVRAIFLFSTEPIIAAGPSTFVDELLRHAGATNIAAGAPTSYPRYGIEGILAGAPDRVLTSVPGGAAALTRMLQGTSLARTPGAIVEVDPDLLERPGPRLADGLALIARALHPAAFPRRAPAPSRKGAGSLTSLPPPTAAPSQPATEERP